MIRAFRGDASMALRKLRSVPAVSRFQSSEAKDAP